MTTLKLSDADGGRPDDLQVRVPWKYVAAWVLAAVLGTNGYRSFIAPVPVAAAADTEQAQQIKELRAEVASLNQKVAVLIAIVERVEAQQTRGRR